MYGDDVVGDDGLRREMGIILWGKNVGLSISSKAKFKPR